MTNYKNTALSFASQHFLFDELKGVLVCSYTWTKQRLPDNLFSYHCCKHSVEAVIVLTTSASKQFSKRANAFSAKITQSTPPSNQLPAYLSSTNGTLASRRERKLSRRRHRSNGVASYVNTSQLQNSTIQIPNLSRTQADRLPHLSRFACLRQPLLVLGGSSAALLFISVIGSGTASPVSDTSASGSAIYPAVVNDKIEQMRALELENSALSSRVSELTHETTKLHSELLTTELLLINAETDTNKTVDIDIDKLSRNTVGSTGASGSVVYNLTNFPAPGSDTHHSDWNTVERSSQDNNMAISQMSLYSSYQQQLQGNDQNPASYDDRAWGDQNYPYPDGTPAHSSTDYMYSTGSWQQPTNNAPRYYYDQANIPRTSYSGT